MSDVEMQASNSEVATFKRCKRKWYLSYYRRLGLEREPRYGARAIGIRVHRCLQQYYQQQVTEVGVTADPLELHDILVNYDCETFPEQEEDIRKDASLSRIMLEGYFEWLEEEGADEGLLVIGAEQAVEHTLMLPLTGTPVKIRGKLDLRVKREHDGATLFLDHKTVQEFTTPTRTLHLDEQMLTYMLLEALTILADEDPDARSDGGVYNMIRKVKRTATSKPPFYMRFEVRHTREEVRSFASRLLGVLQDIEKTRLALDAGDDVNRTCYPTPTRNCSWDCDFFALCPLMDRPSDKPESFMQIAYVENDPYARYNEESDVV
jgi:hypothetical protein